MRQMGGTVISIHAPVKGATGEKIVRKKNAWDISIHAPVKGATSRGRRFFPDLRISIHAPVKGATLFFRRLFVGRRDFNPRTREGCDFSSLSFSTFVIRFQSTHP